jgi:hypothetical protein
MDDVDRKDGMGANDSDGSGGAEGSGSSGNASGAEGSGSAGNTGSTGGTGSSGASKDTGYTGWMSDFEKPGDVDGSTISISDQISNNAREIQRFFGNRLVTIPLFMIFTADSQESVDLLTKKLELKGAEGIMVARIKGKDFFSVFTEFQILSSAEMLSHKCYEMVVVAETAGTLLTSCFIAYDKITMDQMKQSGDTEDSGNAG